MMPLTVVCLLVRGEYPYTPEYVKRLHAMVTRYCDRPFRMVCLTDQSEAMPDGVEAIHVERIPGCFALWTKLRVFDPETGFTGRMLYIDLDSLIVASLAPIIDFPSRLALVEDPFIVDRADIVRDRYGRELVRRFNGSVMVWDADGRHDYLWKNWTLDDAKHWSTDQDFIGHHAIDARPMPLAWFPRLSRAEPPWQEDVKVVLIKKPKNVEACAKWPWFQEAWGGWAA